MKNQKRFFALALILVLLLSFTGCGKAKTSDTVKLIDVPLTSEEYAFGVNKNEPELLQQLNNFIAEIQDNGTFDEITEKYFGDGEPTGIPINQKDDSKDQLVVASNIAFAPFEYMEGELAYGIDMEIMSEFAQSIGKELVLVNMDFDAVLSYIDSGYGDIVAAGLTVNEARKAYVNFSNSYYNASQYIIVKENDTRFDGCKDLASVEAVLNGLDSSVTIGTQNGTTGKLYVDGDESFGFAGLKAKSNGYDNGGMAVQDMLNGNIDFVIIDEAPAKALVKKYNAFTGKWDVFWKSFADNGGYKTVLLGLRNTMIIAVLGLAIGIVIGTLLAVIKIVPSNTGIMKFLKKLVELYVGLFRGTPMVVQLLLFYYVVFPLIGVNIASLTVCIVVFGLNSGAYVSEIMRGGILSVDVGQTEAGRAIGFNFPQTMLKIVIPQAIKNIIPTLGNEFITLVKETSIVSFVAAFDLCVAFRNIGSSNYEFMVPYLVMAIIYIVIIFIFTKIVNYIERRMRASDARH